jgi:hypothetical protein
MRFHRMRAGGFAGLAGLLFTLAGCGKTEVFYPVEGEVQYKGKPLPRGAVILSPDTSKGNKTPHEPRGTIEDGRYQVTTHPNVGAPPGWYRVGVIAKEAPDAKNPYAVTRSLLPEKYGKPDESQLTLEVVEKAAPGSYDLLLK